MSEDKEILEIQIEVHSSTPLEKIDEEIRARLQSHRVEQLLSAPENIVVIRLTSEGPFPAPPR
jgi:hypothetical protein